MTNTPLNPDALDAGAKAMYNEKPWQKSTYSVESHSWEEIQEEDRQAFREEAETAVTAYLAEAYPVAQKITGAEWLEFQMIPLQDYSHRAWVDARIAERLAVAQPVVNSAEELDKLPVEAVVRDANGFTFENDLYDQTEEFKWLRVGLSPRIATWGIELPATVLYLPPN